MNFTNSMVRITFGQGCIFKSGRETPSHGFYVVPYRRLNREVYSRYKKLGIFKPLL